MTSAGTFLLLPAYNEAAHLPSVLEELSRLGGGFTVVVVDDGSRDATSEVARAGGARVVRHPFNMGYGAALQTGYKFALEQGARIVVQMDSDGQHDPGQIEKILAPVAAGELDLAIGSRFFPGSEYESGLARDVGRRIICSVARLMGLRLEDPTSGFQAMNREVLKLYCRDSFPYDYPDLDVLVLARRGGLRIGERPTAMRAGLRPSQLHGGLRPVYYFYRLALALLAASAAKKEARS